MTGLTFGRRFSYRYSPVTCAAGLACIAALAGCGGGGASATSATGTTSAAAAKATSQPSPSQWPSPYGTDWIVFHGDCDYTMQAYSTFLQSYKSAASLPEKNLAAANAGADFADAAYDLVKKLPLTQQVVLTLSNRMTTVVGDFRVVESDLQKGNQGAADSAIKTRLQSDENAVSAICGPEV